MYIVYHVTDRMKLAGITPNQIVFTSAMEACAEVRISLHRHILVTILHRSRHLLVFTVHLFMQTSVCIHTTITQPMHDFASIPVQAHHLKMHMRLNFYF